MVKRGIIIANTGTPDAPEPEAVKRYLREFLSDPRICPMNPLVWKIILNTCILPRRSVASARKYQGIWTPEGSPLAVTMASLARKLEAALAASAGAAADTAPMVRSAMSYGSPSLAAALAEFQREGCEEVLLIPLYPQSAFSTTESVLDRTRRTLAELGWNPPLATVHDYGDHPLYQTAIADSIRAAGFDSTAGDRLLFAFHSIPLADIAAGDTYGDQARSTAQTIARCLGLAPEEWGIGFQCRFDKSRRWLGPFTKETLEHLMESPPAGGRLFVVAPNFSIDCLETLYDIEVELRDSHRSLAGSAEPAGGTQGSQAPEAGRGGSKAMRYIPCLNDSEAQVRLLCALIVESSAASSSHSSDNGAASPETAAAAGQTTSGAAESACQPLQEAAAVR